MAATLAPLKCTVIQSTSDEAPGLLASVEHHLGAHHSPDLFHVQHELSQAVSAPLAIKQRAAAQALQTAEDTLNRVQEHLSADVALPQRGTCGQRLIEVDHYVSGERQPGSSRQPQQGVGLTPPELWAIPPLREARFLPILVGNMPY